MEPNPPPTERDEMKIEIEVVEFDEHFPLSEIGFNEHSLDVREISQAAARIYHSMKSGYVVSWPLTFLITVDDEFFASTEIDCVPVPEFDVKILRQANRKG